MEIINQIKEKLADVGLKATHPRMVVFRELIEAPDHPSAEMIHQRILPANPSISLGSVYRVLDALLDAGLIKGVSIRKGSKRYDSNLNPHGHIYCLKTDLIQDFYDEGLNDLINEFFRKKKIKNLKINEIKLQVIGERLDPESTVTIN